MRAERERAHLPQVALVGYTNAGKSTLLNQLTGATVGVADRLFHTLDPSTRAARLNGRPYLLTDTVGFIRKLPHQLVDAFGATLEETVMADLVLHVVDASVPEVEMDEMLRAVDSVLDEIGAGDRPRLLVLNKADALDDERLEELRFAHPDGILVSALTGAGIDELGERVEHAFRETLRSIDLLLPFDEGGRLAELHELAGELERVDTAEGVRVRGRVPATVAERYARFDGRQRRRRLLARSARGRVRGVARGGRNSITEEGVSRQAPAPGRTAVDYPRLPTEIRDSSGDRSRQRRRRLHSLGDAVSSRPHGARAGSARVARARQHPALLAREQLVEVGLGDLLELQAGLGGDLGHVPEHVAELARQRLQALVGHDAAVVAQQLLDLLGHLAGLAGQAQRRVDDVVARARVGRGAPREPLVVGEEHGRRR